MSWVKQTFSDGEKPSLARQLIALIVAVMLTLFAAHSFWPKRVAEPGSGILDQVVNVLEGLMAWAGWSRGVTAVKAAKEKATDLVK